jgi:hypothetical protein
VMRKPSRAVHAQFRTSQLATRPTDFRLPQPAKAMQPHTAGTTGFHSPRARQMNPPMATHDDRNRCVSWLLSKVRIFSLSVPPVDRFRRDQARCRPWRYVTKARTSERGAHERSREDHHAEAR